MELTTESIAIFAIGVSLWFLIIHLIISAAVKSGTSNQEYFMKMIHRMYIKQMVQDGFSKEELSKMHTDTHEQFWESLGIPDPKKENPFKEKSKPT